LRGSAPPLPLTLAIAALAALALAHAGEIRARADAALARGMPEREAELARGFVLGEDDGIDRGTVEDFRRSGLSHLLAVSGQNVTLLALLAVPLLAALNIPLEQRLLWLLALIAAYVPLAGASPSIQRAAVMGAVGLVATLGGRRGSRLWAFGAALAATLAVEPSIAADVGWQLSFAAVAGIFALAAPLRAAIGARIGRSGWRAALAEGAAVTIAATLATAPLIAFHFEAISTTTLAANLLALPAVAPAMWLGMLSAALAQVPGLGFAVAALNALDAPLLAYVAQIARWCGAPAWAYVHMHLTPLGLLAAYAGLALAVGAALWLARRRAVRPRRERSPAASTESPLRPLRPLPALTCCCALAILGWALLAPSPDAPGLPGLGLRIEVLDVGQGDAILLQPARGAAILVDGGPPGDGLTGMLRSAGVDRLGAAVLTHEQSDHAGGIEELFGDMPVGRFDYAVASRQMLAEARAAGAAPERVAAGDELRSGRLRLDVLWPPRELLSAPPAGSDPNQLAVVALARWRGFSMLLTADAEAESVPLDPGPVDVLKVAHHGSDDAGLGSLLDRIGARLAVISVGRGNPFGHPTAATLRTLRGHGVKVMRTDLEGTVEIDVGRGSWRAIAADQQE
jgi:competence protein ComEC